MRQGCAALFLLTGFYSLHAPGYPAYTGFADDRESSLVDEMIFSFTHTQEMPWMLPGVPATNRKVEIPLVAIVAFRDGKLVSEHIYWDQASVLKQIGLLTDPRLPVRGVETGRKVVEPGLVVRKPGKERRVH